MTDESPDQSPTAAGTSSSAATGSTIPAEDSLSLALPPPPSTPQQQHPGVLSSGGLTLLCASVDFAEISFKEVDLFFDKYLLFRP